MGISNEFHFAWLNEVIGRQRQRILNATAETPMLIGLSEQAPNPVFKELFGKQAFTYQGYDRYPKTADIQKYEINHLGGIQTGPADFVTCFRASYFMEDKEPFFREVKRLVKPGGFLAMDFLIGSALAPDVGYRYGAGPVDASYDRSAPSVFKTTLYDDRLLETSYPEVAALCRHARRWPLDAAWRYLRNTGWRQWPDIFRLGGLTPETLGSSMQTLFAPANLISLADFARHDFSVLEFDARYFYPATRKFNLYIVTLAQYTPGKSANNAL